MIILLLLSVLAVIGVAGETSKDMSYRVIEQGEYKEIEVTTALANYIFSEDGGVLKSVFLSFAPYGSKVVELVPGTKTDSTDMSRKYTANILYPFSVQAGEETTLGTYTSHVDRLSPDEIVVEFRRETDDLIIIKRFVIYNDPYYTIDLTLTVDNRILAEGSYASFDGLGLMDKATVFFLKADSAPGVNPFVDRILSGTRQFGVELSASQGTTSYSFSLYGGRRRYLLMEHSGLGKLDDPGTAARMMIPVIQFLDILYRYTGNYGWAIILFTLITRVILFPLMRKQYHSMAKMQKMQPRMKKLQERFKDDRQLMQQKLMELYKKEGVNPMGGCLPMFVQLPILILLWRAILYSGEQIHLSPGFLWLSDLSLRDPYFILVILTTAVMILQQKLMTPMTTGETKGSQKYMGYLMPVMMAFFLYNFPAGMWLYYLLTTLLQVGQQYFVNWEMAKADGGMVPIGVSDDPIDIEAEEPGGGGELRDRR